MEDEARLGIRERLRCSRFAPSPQRVCPNSSASSSVSTSARAGAIAGVLLLAAVLAVPQHLYESAQLDGWSSSWRSPQRAFQTWTIFPLARSIETTWPW